MPGLVLALIALHLYYWQQIDLRGRPITCTVDRKDERIDHRSRSDSWTPVFRVTLTCPWREAGAPSFPTFDTDEAEYDRLQRGMPFEVRYVQVPIPLMLLGAPASHLARETTSVHIAHAIAKFTPIAGIAAYLLVLSFLGWLLSRHKIPGLRWIFFAMLLVALIWALTPTLPIIVSGTTAQTTATVKEVYRFTRLLDSKKSHGIDAITPYELVVLQYLPQGRKEPVLGADMIDTGSYQPLAAGQQVPIDYEVASPRRANIQGARRLYYWENVEGAIVEGALIVGFLIGGSLLWDFIKKRAKQALADAQERARDQEMIRRSERR